MLGWCWLAFFFRRPRRKCEHDKLAGVAEARMTGCPSPGTALLKEDGLAGRRNGYGRASEISAMRNRLRSDVPSSAVVPFPQCRETASLNPSSRRLLLATRQASVVTRFREVLRRGGFQPATLVLPAMLPGGARREPRMPGADRWRFRRCVAVAAGGAAEYARFAVGSVQPERDPAAGAVGVGVRNGRRALHAVAGGRGGAGAACHLRRGRQFRFQPPAVHRMLAPAAVASEEFDAAWMFGV